MKKLKEIKTNKRAAKPTIKIVINDGPFLAALKNLQAHLVDFVHEEHVQRRAVMWAPEWD